MGEQYQYMPHRLLRRRVRDIPSGVEGELMAVINENVSGTATSSRPTERLLGRGDG
ncbi:hypothetical protein ACFWG0_24560 [Streptomyces yangpuensis]|uniref:hypothetical protein n=1 Tax=Streptomyces yangpuensis TaxID=1648182 RepID=UPI003658A5F1